MNDLDFTPLNDDEKRELRHGVEFSEKIVTGEQFIKAQQFRMEELLLNKIYEQVASKLPRVRDLGPDTEPTETFIGYCDGYSDALEDFWGVIIDHVDSNRYEMKRW
jgi:hypothetical protein